MLNVDIFTPALVFSKLAPSLSLKKLFEIIIIPIFYAISTGISYIVSLFVSKYLKLDEYESNFVTAMSVFGNSNSLPVSLTVALAYTLPNLEWNDVDDDNASKIASRGILYLLIFQQIGQVLRWSWGYNTLLKRRSVETINILNDELENGQGLHITFKSSTKDRPHSKHIVSSERISNASSCVTLSEQSDTVRPDSSNSDYSVTDRLLGSSQFDSFERTLNEVTSDIENEDQSSLPRKIWTAFVSFGIRFKNAMNPPLYAMAAAVFVASVPSLQKAFYFDNGFIHNTVAEAITQLGSVSIPLILIVLGSNLYPSKETPSPSKNYKKIVFGSLASRMIIPPLILLPLIAIAVKIFPVSILDDPIFLIVSFVLTISPPAIQLSQICQLNELYESEMAGILFWGYVVLTLPTTIATVSTALTVLEWAK